MFFKPKPNLPDSEKARIEFHFQQIAECIGLERMKLPILRLSSLVEMVDSKSPADIIRFLGGHLRHDTSGVQFEVVHSPKAASCGGGG